MGLYEKMFKVMEESTAIEKSMTVGSGKNSYKAISEAVVLNGIKPLLKKHKLILFPIEAEIKEVVDEYSSYGDTKARLMSQVVAKYKIVDVDSGESEILATVGNGADPQDKGSGKAWTYAYKALLQKTFCLFSGEDTDNTHSNDIDGSNEKITVKQLDKIAKEIGKTTGELLNSYNKNHNKNLTDIKFVPQDSKKAMYDWCLQQKAKK